MTDRIGLNELEEGQVLLQVLQVSAGGSVEQVEVVRHTADPQPDPPDPPQHQVRLTDYPLGVADVEREREREWWQQLPAPVEVGRGGTSIDCGRGTLVRPRGKLVSRVQSPSTQPHLLGGPVRQQVHEANISLV